MDWQQAFRDNFPITREKIYACQAYSSPLSPRVSQAMQDFFSGVTHARADKPEWLATAEGVRVQVARLIGGSARRVAFTKNTTEGLNIVAQGFPWREGDNMVIDDQEHPVNVVPWLNLRRRGVEVRVAATQDRQVTLDALWARVDDRTRLIAVSYVQYSTGVRADIQALGARCRERGIRLVVDGIQAVGLLPIDVEGWGVDALACGAYKPLLGPLGLGFLHLSPELLAELEPAFLGASAVNKVRRNVADWQLDAGTGGDARLLEGGNINYPAVYGLAPALLMIEQARIDRLAPWVLGLGAQLDSGLRAQGYELFSSDVEGENSSIVCLRHPESFALRKYFYMEGVVSNLLDTGAVRLSFGGYNTPAEVARILDITGRFASDANLRRHLLKPTASRPY